ncbi:DUF6518 family protein [Streptomyces sp. NPDC003036]|uniref:DUF6518 family protein n=1 Tax=Streptomyces sp. NPDC003036 TaxID=3154442 RepID=UPI0033AB0446
MKTIAAGLAGGAAFGAATSVVNALSSPYVELGAPLADSVWGDAAKVLSLLLDVGWAWAALAVVMGYAAATPARGAAAGALALLAATTTYYLTDSLILGDPLASYAGDLGLWSMASVLFGPVLGVAGATVGSPGVTGLLAGLTVRWVRPPR